MGASFMADLGVWNKLLEIIKCFDVELTRDSTGLTLRGLLSGSVVIIATIIWRPSGEPVTQTLTAQI